MEMLGRYCNLYRPCISILNTVLKGNADSRQSLQISSIFKVIFLRNVSFFCRIDLYSSWMVLFSEKKTLLISYIFLVLCDGCIVLERVLGDFFCQDNYFCFFHTTS